MSLHAYEILEQSGMSSTYFGTGDMIVAETKEKAERLARKKHVYHQRIKAAKMSDRSGFAQRLIQKENPSRKKGSATKRLGNPARKSNQTKLQRMIASTKRAKQNRMSAALKKFLHQANPALETSGAMVTKLKGGGFTIQPIKVVKVTRGGR